MLIRRVTLENYGLYTGMHEFDLVPRTKYKLRRPVILFGGKNGAGKTTLLEAVRLALYGKAALGARVSQKEYKTFLNKRIHRSKDAVLQPSYAAVGIQFDYVIRGEVSEFQVERSWDYQKSGAAKEQLAVLKDGQPLEDVDPEFWEDFVQGIVPERLSRLFFFDGEQITSIAEDETGTGALADSIKSLLGLDLVESLKADLSIHSSRIARKTSSGKEKQQLENLAKRSDDLGTEIRVCEENLASVRTQITGVQDEIARREAFLADQGYAYARQRTSLMEKQSVLGERIEYIEKELRQECEGMFPLSLCPAVTTALRQQLKAEEELRQWTAMRDGLKSIEKDIRSSIASSLKLSGKKPSSRSMGDIQDFVHQVFQERLATPDRIKGVTPVHNLSQPDAEGVRRQLDMAESESAPHAKQLAADLEKAQRALRKVKVSLGRVPEEVAIKPIIEELGGLNKRLGELTERHADLEKLRDSLDHERTAVDRGTEKLEDQLREREDSEGRLRLSKALQSALTDYLDRLAAEKIRRLRSSVAECFNRLCRKGDVLQDIDIDSRTFAVTLFDHKHRAIPKEELSAGEKQIFAIAFLWGLATTSGRQLPMIIDTPLARLDSDHRRNLIQNYLPHASHQVIILSTDTEVDQDLFADLSPNVSHSYHLDYDETEGCTKPVEGYFWKEAANA